MLNVTTSILAGGLGTRLRPAVANRPKVLAEIRGRPFLAYLLDQLAVATISEVVLCTGYLGDQVRAFFGDSYRGLGLTYSQESKPLGTAGALRLALPLLNSDPVLVLNGDSFCDLNLGAFLAWHSARKAEATMALVGVNDTRRYGRVHLDDERTIVSFDEKDDNGNPGWINTGVYLLPRSLIQTIPEHRAVSLEREMFPAWIGKGLYGYPSEGRFLDIGTPQAYRLAKQFFSPNMPI